MVTIPGTGKNWLRYFQYEERRDTPSDTRNILLIIFTLVAAVTFQAAVNPPGGVWQETKDGNSTGRATYALLDKKGYYVFLIFNTWAFANSVFIILSLTHKFPFQLEIWTATVSMSVSYGSAIFAITPKDPIHLRYVLITATGPIVLGILVRTFNLFLRKHFVKDTHTPPNSDHS